MALNSNSLITIDDYLIYIAEDTDVSEQRRARIEQLINIASQEISTHLNNRVMFSGSTATEIFDGLGQPHPDLLHNEYVTINAPIIEDPTPKLFVRNGTTWDAVDSTAYSWDATLGYIYFTQCGYFAKGKKNYKVVYDYGYANAAAIPSDLQAATSIIVRHYETLSDRQGKSSETIGTQTFSYQNEIPKAAITILDRYNR